MIAPLPAGPFEVIYADCPWRYEFMKVSAWAVERTYPTLTVPELLAMGPAVRAISRPQSVLFLWSPSPKLPQALEVMQSWGFSYRSSLVWVKHKNRAGMGYWLRVGHELLLVGTREKASPPPPERRFPSVMEVKKGKHSAKPGEVRTLIEAMFPAARRIELFARGVAPEGWVFWGDEALPLTNS